MSQALLVGWGQQGTWFEMTGPEGPVKAQLGQGPAGNALALLGPFTSVVQGAAGTGRLADMPSAAFTGLPDGTEAYVSTLQCNWVRFSSPTSISSDTVTIFKPLGGASRLVWLRRAGSIYYWNQKATWSIDAAAGNFENSGLDAAHAIDSYDELVRRLAGSTGIITPTTAVVVNQIGDYAGAANLVINCVNGSFIVQGVLPAPSFDNVLTAVTNLNAGTSTFTQATAAWVVANEVDRLVHDVTADKWAWVMKDLGAGAARMSPWTTINLATGGGITVAIGNALVGDEVQTFVLPKLGQLSLSLIGGGFGGPAPVAVQTLNITGTQGRSRITSLGQQIAIQNCVFSTNIERVEGGTVSYNNCLRTDNATTGTLGGNDMPGILIFNSGAVHGNAGALSVSSSFVNFNSQTYFQNCTLIVGRGALCRINDANWADSVNPISISTLSKLFVGTTLWGANNTGAGVVCARESDIVITGTPTLTGNVAGVDFTLNAATTALPFDVAGLVYAAARNCSWVNLVAAFGAGGFGGSIFDPPSGCRVGVGT